MKKTIYIFTLLFVLISCKKTVQTENNPFLADPTIFYWEGVYYLYGTGGIIADGKNNPDEGFLVYTSTDLKNWEGPKGAGEGFALRKGESYGTWGFWAPQVFHYNNRFYMAYTADEHIAVASASNPLGPFRQEELKPISTVSRQIDPYVFFDDDGKIYMYHVRLLEGNRLFVAEMNDELTYMDENTLTECINADEGTWEDTQNVDWRVAEGPTIIKEAGTYYFFYSANDFRNIDYSVGYATSGSPFGPWTKTKENPIIDRHLIKDNGPGHGDIFFNNKNEMYYVLHTHFSDEKVAPRKTGIIQLQNTGGGFKANAGSFRFIDIKNN